MALWLRYGQRYCPSMLSFANGCLQVLFLYIQRLRDTLESTVVTEITTRSKERSPNIPHCIDGPHAASLEIWAFIWNQAFADLMSQPETNTMFELLACWGRTLMLPSEWGRARREDRQVQSRKRRMRRTFLYSQILHVIFPLFLFDKHPCPTLSKLFLPSLSSSYTSVSCTGVISELPQRSRRELT